MEIFGVRVTFKLLALGELLGDLWGRKSMADFSRMKLGKLPHRHDVRTLKLSKYMAQLPEIPDFRNWGTATDDWKMMLNDELGCCTISGAGHMMMEGKLWNNQAFELSDSEVKQAYSDVSGYDGSSSTDNGAVMLDVLNYWRNKGIAGHKILAFVSINPQNTRLVRAAIELFGAVYAGVDLPSDAQRQQIWSVAGDGKSGNHAPGSWGGHCIPLVGFDTAAFNCITWGMPQWMTEAWWKTYGTEAWVVITQEWVDANSGIAPSQMNLSQLLSDLSEIEKED